MPKHAFLSASSCSRWLACPPSAKLCAGIVDSGSPYAQEGTDAHALCEYKVNHALGRPCEDPTENLSYFNTEMDDCSDQYCEYVMEQVTEAKDHCKDPLVLVEEKLDFSHWVPDGFGTGDCVIIADDILQIVDFKYGVGVLVDANENPQMMCYALGALDQYGFLYDIRHIRMTIFQPRRDNISTFEIDTKELLKWAEEVLKPAAALAFEGKGEYKAGPHCQFCKAKATCRKRAEYNLELAKYDFKMPAILSDEEVASLLPRIDQMISWADDLKDFALKKALAGTHYPGFKLVAGKSSRKYSDQKAVASIVENAGYDPYEKKLLGITAMTSLLGKKKFEELLGSYVTKPQGKPALVPESDKRPELNTAANDFENEKGE